MLLKIRGVSAVAKVTIEHRRMHELLSTLTMDCIHVSLKRFKDEIEIPSHNRIMANYLLILPCRNWNHVWIRESQHISGTVSFYYKVISPKAAVGNASSVDPDQTAPPLGAAWSGSALFAKAYLSENLRSLRYMSYKYLIIKAMT